jgi:hypothetical protein
MNAANQHRSTVTPAHNSLWLRIARSAWYVLAAIALGIFFASLPGFVALASKDLRASVQSPVILAFGVLAVILSILVALLSLSLAWVLFRRGGGDRMSMLVSFFLLAHGVTAAGPLEGLEPFLPGAADLAVFVLQPLLLSPLTIFIFAVFPDGRFVPSWSRWIVVLTLVLALLNVIFSPVGPVEHLGDAQATLIGLSNLGLLVVGAAILYAQIHRYRRVSTPVQRQQTKWVIYGLAIALLLAAASSGPWLALQAMPPGSPPPDWVVVLTPIWVISTAAIPASLAISVLRFRLWDIDVIIRKTATYSVLTGLLALVYFGCVLVLQAVFSTLGGQRSEWAIVVSTLAIAALFFPLRRRVQNALDRRFFRRKYDAQKVLEQFAATARDETDLEKLTARLVEVVQETMQPKSVSVWLKTESQVSQTTRGREKVL